MVFSSPVFLFLFLPLALGAYFAAPRCARNLVLLLASLFFYAWGEKGYVLLMIGSIIVNFALGFLVESGRERTWGKAALTLAVILNLVPLIYFKYVCFLIANLTPFEVANAIHLPIGISFFTFEAIAYLVDVRRGLTQAQRDPVTFGLFMTLFPHLIAGPVVRYRDLETALEGRTITRERFAAGIRRFIIGLSKKVLLANTLAKTADHVFEMNPGSLDASAAWLGVLCYSLHIYFDFSGYSDMAIGLGRLFGFELCENFRYPYAASSVTDFWRRWHISLSSWFRDYVYIPLGGNRHGARRTAINLITVFALCGLWHGASWNFLVWGLYHGLFLAMERLPFSFPAHPLLRLPRHLLTLAIVMVGWVFFRSEHLPGAMLMIGSMVGFGAGHCAADFMNRELAIALVVGMVAALPIGRSIRERIGDGVVVQSLTLFALLILFAVCIIWLAAGTFNPFIYFRF